MKIIHNATQEQLANIVETAKNRFNGQLLPYRPHVDFEHEMKVKALNGLSYFIEVCLRRQQYEDIDEVLTYVFNQLKYNYHDMFKRKLERINKSRKHNVQRYDEYIKEGSIGDRFEAAKKGAQKSTKLGSLGEILTAAILNSEKTTTT